MNPMVKHFPQNAEGRDFVVGDIHGCFDKLRTCLDEYLFDETLDRLFSVGDLVDRGSQCEESIDWIAKPWFHAVRGNHEQMAIGIANGKHDRGNYKSNGGGWFLDMEEDHQRLFSDVFCTLPYAIDIETKHGLVGIVHAECGPSWPEFCDALINPESKTKLRNVHETALWSRTKITYGDQSLIDGLVALFVGHTPVDDWKILGNVHYVDTGAVFGGKLTVLEIV